MNSLQFILIILLLWSLIQSTGVHVVPYGASGQSKKKKKEEEEQAQVNTYTQTHTPQLSIARMAYKKKKKDLRRRYSRSHGKTPRITPTQALLLRTKVSEPL